MNIAHLLPASAKFPLTKHNGRYEWAYRLARLQVETGHQVTIYSSVESVSDGSRLQMHGLQLNSGTHLEHNMALIREALHDKQHDIFHSHFDDLHYRLATETTKPIVFTQHWFPNKKIAEAAHACASDNVLAVPVTHYMHNADTELGIPATNTIYHGIDLQSFQPSAETRTDRLIYVGRIAPHKGVREIVELTLAAGEQLDIVGKINPVDTAYWESILPLVDGRQVRYIGSVPHSEVAHLLRQARAFVFAPQQPEAFGQVILEAQACGTPAIILDDSAARELVINGRTGFVFSTLTEFKAAVGCIPSIKSADCRTFAEKFDVQTMAQSYEQLYTQLLTHGGQR